MNQEDQNYLKTTIQTIPDHPIPGIMFRDFTSLMLHPKAWALCVNELVEEATKLKATHIAGLEARGFLLAGAMAYNMGVGLVPLRKKGKLPGKTYSQNYTLEYGEDALEVHQDALGSKDRVYLVDDLLATGGTLTAGVKLVKQCGAEVVGSGVVITLPELQGAAKLQEVGVEVSWCVSFEGH